MCITTTIHLGYVKCRQHAAHPGVGIDASVADEEVVTANRRRGVPTGVCVKQAMDGLRRRVRQGGLSSRGACPGWDDAVSGARAKTACLDLHVPQLGEEPKKNAAIAAFGCFKLPVRSACGGFARRLGRRRSEEHTSELQSLMRISYAVFCLKKTNTKK